MTEQESKELLKGLKTASEKKYKAERYCVMCSTLFDKEFQKCAECFLKKKYLKFSK